MIILVLQTVRRGTVTWLQTTTLTSSLVLTVWRRVPPRGPTMTMARISASTVCQMDSIRDHTHHTPLNRLSSVIVALRQTSLKRVIPDFQKPKVKRMALNLDGLLKPQWQYQTKSGVWNVYHYTTNAAIIVERNLDDRNTNAVDCIRDLIGEICTKSSLREDQAPREGDITPDVLATLSAEDIHSFACQFLENDWTVKAETGSWPDRSPEQSDAEYLLEVLQVENSKQNAKMAKIFEDMKPKFPNLFGSANFGLRNVAKDLEAQNEAMLNTYGSSGNLLEYPALASPKFDIPPHPAHVTNNHLGDMNQRLDNLIGFGENALGIMHGLQGASAEFLEKFSIEAHNTSRAANKAIWVGVFAVLFAVAQIAYTEFWRVPQDTAAMDAAIIQMQTEIGELQGAVTASYEANAAVLQGVQTLLQDQQKLDGRVLTVLEAITNSLGDLDE